VVRKGLHKRIVLAGAVQDDSLFMQPCTLAHGRPPVAAGAGRQQQQERQAYASLGWLLCC
jgi:hypothetical protein